MLKEREAFSAMALCANGAKAGAAEIAARGLATLPAQFSRPAAMPDGSLAETRFHTFHVAWMSAPGLRIFASQHLTPKATWVPG
jgi:hypothetical protein